ncbi:MAG: TolC family protein [Flavobacteriales bacterium]|nr:TolC family protein [Flavobacteriales bacterium]
MKKLVLIIWLALWSGVNIVAQVSLSKEEAIQLALARHPSVMAAREEVKAAEALEKTAFSLPNPVLFVESPTGEFYTPGISQSLEFPTVYAGRSKALQAATGVASARQNLSTNELILEVSLAHAEARYQHSRLQLFGRRDSLYEAMMNLAERRFNEGEGDALELSYAKLVYGRAHGDYVESSTSYQNALHMLVHAFLDSTVYEVAAFGSDYHGSVSISMSPTSSLTMVAAAETLLAEKEYRLQRQSWLPGIMLGYLNQGPRETSPGMALQAGITLPLWWWQYSGRIQAADAKREAAKLHADDVMLDVHTAWQQHLAAYELASQRLSYYSLEALPTADNLAIQSTRFFEAGETDLVTHLRNLNEALLVELEFVNAAYDVAVEEAYIEFLQH